MPATTLQLRLQWQLQQQGGSDRAELSLSLQLPSLEMAASDDPGTHYPGVHLAATDKNIMVGAPTPGDVLVPSVQALNPVEQVNTNNVGMNSGQELKDSRQKWQQWQSLQIGGENMSVPCLLDGKRGRLLYHQWTHANMEPENGTFLWYRWRLACFMESEPMQVVILSLVVLNAVFQAHMNHICRHVSSLIWLQGIQIDMETTDNYEIFENIDITVLTIFVLEIAVKVVAFGPSRYLGYRMNLFDLSVVAIAVSGEIVSAFGHHSGSSNITDKFGGSTCTAVHPAAPYYELPLLHCSGCCASSPCSKA